MAIKPPAPPYVGPPAHWTAGDNMPIHRIVVHCTVSKCCVDARGIGAYFRTQAAGGSAHYIVDASGAVQSTYDSVIAWHAPPNQNSLGVELCCTLADQGKGHWVQADHQQMLKQAAHLIAQLALAYHVPITKLSVDDVKAGRHGICGHVDVSNAFHQSSHWDPGPYFPWDSFMAMVAQAAADLSSPTAPPAPKPIVPTRGTHVDAALDELQQAQGKGKRGRLLARAQKLLSRIVAK